jgi:ribosome-associated toxin RatA of RatAB toxin-antitoxin module
MIVMAEPARIFGLARDVTRWPQLLPHYRRVTVQGRHGDRTLAQMIAIRRLGPLSIPVSWRAETWADDTDPADLRLRFRHVRGVTRGMDVTWHIRPTAQGARVTIDHDFRRPLPLVGGELVPWFVDRLFTHAIATRTLATFKLLAEAVTPIGAAPAAAPRARRAAPGASGSPASDR